MNNFNSFFETLSRGKAGGGAEATPAQPAAPAPAPAPALSSTLSPSLSASTSASSAPGAGGEERASGQIVGMEVSQPSFTFSNASGEEAERLPHPQCTPIAFYNSEAPYGSGRLIAVSDSYICYAIKDGHIRGINRHSVLRTLLKGHKKPAIDMAFASRSTCVLASLGGDGSFFLWTIVEGPSRDPSKGKAVDLTPVPLLSVTNVHLQRVVWHPQRTQVVAVVGPAGEVALVDTHALIEALGGGKPGSGPAPQLAATSLADLRPEWQVNAHVGSKVLDLSFSKDGRHLVTAGADGWARVWDVEARTAMARWQPYGGEPVTRALFLHRSKGPSTGEKTFVVTGGRQDAEVKLWRAWTTLTPINTQTLAFQDQDGQGRAFHLDADESGEFLLLADNRRPTLYVAHVVLGPSSAKVDRLTPFQLKHPVLSLLTLPGVAVDAHEGAAAASAGAAAGAAEVQVYCVQTQAIQIYHLRPEDCAAGATAAAPALAPSAPAPVAPAPSAGGGQQPAILQMLLQASQAAGAGAGASAPASAPAAVAPRGASPGLVTPQSLAAAAAGGAGAPRRAGEDEASTQSVAAALSEEKQTGGARTTEEKVAATGASPAAARPATVATPPRQPGATTAGTAGSAAAAAGGAGGGAGGGVTDGGAVLARLDGLAERVAASTRAAVAEALGGVGPELQRNVDKAVRAAVAGQLEAAAADARQAAVAGLGAAVKEPVAASFKECFEKMLIPAMQTTTQRMFAQMNEALTKNIAALGASAGAAGGQGASSAALTQVRGEVGEVKGQIAALATAVTALSAQLEALGGRLGSANGPGVAGGGGGRGGLDTALDESLGAGAGTAVKEELRRLLRAGRFNEAFQQALGASDLELVTWLCAEAPRDDIFDQDPPLLSQTILLCLMQQLSFNLGRRAAVKLEWLKQISLVFNPADPEVASFVAGVLGQLQDNLEAAATEVVALGDQERAKDFKFVQRAVKRMIATGR